MHLNSQDHSLQQLVTNDYSVSLVRYAAVSPERTDSCKYLGTPPASLRNRQRNSPRSRPPGARHRASQAPHRMVLTTREPSACVSARSAVSSKRTDSRENFWTPGFRAETTAEVPHKVQPGFHGAVQPLYDRLQIARNHSRLVPSQLSPGPVQQLQVLIQ